MTKLSEYLTDHDISQNDFAEKIGTTQATVSRLVSGKVKPGLPLAVLIERETGGIVPPSSWVENKAATAA